VSDKLKPNFTPIPNIILDSILRTLAPGATKVLFAICRYTYGWGKPDGDRISLKQLQEITGMARGSVARSVKDLGPLVAVMAGDPKRQLASEYRINIEISDDDLVTLRDQGLVSKRDQASLLASLSGETFQRKSKERRYTVAKATESSSIKRSRKLTRPDPAALAAFEKFYAVYPRRVGRKDALKAWLSLSPSSELIAAIMAGVGRYAVAVADTDQKFIKHPGPWLNGRRWEDETLPGNGANSHAPQVKDLGNGYVEVDGRTMDKRTFERRFANAR
jgi:hypothetical protein